MRLRLLSSAPVVALAAFAATPAAAAVIIGSDLTGSPTAGCSSIECVMTQEADDAGRALTAAASGVVVRVRVKHSAADSSLDQIGFKVLSGSGPGHAVVGDTGPRAFPQLNVATTSTFTFSPGLPIAAGQRLAVYVLDTNPSETRVSVAAPSASGDVVGFVSGDHVASQGQRTYSTATGYELLLSADVEPDADGDGRGDETQDNCPTVPNTDQGTNPCAGGGAGGAGAGGGGTGAGGSGAGGGAGGSSAGGSGAGGSGASGGALQCPTSGATVRAAVVADRGGTPAASSLALAPRRAVASARRWRATVLDRPGSGRAYKAARIAFGPGGVRHVIGQVINPNQVVYFGPGGRRVIDRVGYSNTIALAVGRGGTAIVGYGDLLSGSGPAPGPGLTGPLVSCNGFKLSLGPAFAPSIFSLRPEGDRGFQFLDVAADPRSGATLTAYVTGLDDALVYQPAGGGAAQQLGLTGVRRIRVAARGGTVALAASTARVLKVFTRRGSGPFRVRTIAAGPIGSWDMDLASDGRPRLALVTGKLKLALFNGRRLVRTSLWASQVGLAVDAARRLHVVATKTGGPSCLAWRGFVLGSTCVGNGIYYLATDAAVRRGRTEVVQRSLGQSVQLSVAVSGRKVAVAYANAGDSSSLYVRTR